LLEDMRQVQTSDTGGIDKTKNAHQSHLLDCWLYYNWNYHRKFLQNIPAYVQD
jgi:hypothetical protein